MQLYGKKFYLQLYLRVLGFFSDRLSLFLKAKLDVQNLGRTIKIVMWHLLLFSLPVITSLVTYKVQDWKNMKKWPHAQPHPFLGIFRILVILAGDLCSIFSREKKIFPFLLSFTANKKSVDFWTFPFIKLVLSLWLKSPLRQ